MQLGTVIQTDYLEALKKVSSERQGESADEELPSDAGGEAPTQGNSKAALRDVLGSACAAAAMCIRFQRDAEELNGSPWKRRKVGYRHLKTFSKTYMELHPANYRDKKKKKKK